MGITNSAVADDIHTNLFSKDNRVFEVPRKQQATGTEARK